MGWKSTVTISKDEAIDLIINRMKREAFEFRTNEELAKILECIGYGDKSQLEYYGCNFIVVDKIDKNE